MRLLSESEAFLTFNLAPTRLRRNIAALGFLQKVNTGFGTAIAGFVLSIIGFTSTNPSDDQVFFLISAQGGLVPIMLLIPIVIFYFYNLDREKHRSIQEELRLRKL